MRTFNQFMTLCEAIYDTDKPSDVPLEVERIGRKRIKSAAERKYKPYKYATGRRSDAGKTRARSEREQQPTQERGSAALSAKEAQRKAYLERKARESGGKAKSKELESQATALLKKKKEQPKREPRKASGLSTQERKALYKKGERTLRDIVLAKTGKKSEKELKHKYTSK